MRSSSNERTTNGNINALCGPIQFLLAFRAERKSELKKRINTPACDILPYFVCSYGNRMWGKQGKKCRKNEKNPLGEGAR